jgi:hypothetical protein
MRHPTRVVSDITRRRTHTPEEPCVAGSIPALGTASRRQRFRGLSFRGDQLAPSNPCRSTDQCLDGVPHDTARASRTFTQIDAESGAAFD